MKRSFLNFALAMFLALRAFGEEGRGADAAIYDRNPNHLWNRLNETLFVRTAPDGKQFGRDELDILYWPTTQHLLVEPSHQQALAVLDEFIDSRGEKMIRDPLKRALLQRDLWELFDWSAKGGRNSGPPQPLRELQSRLAVLIRRLALTTNEIASLPDNYVQSEKSNVPDLPRRLFETNGDWVVVGVNGSEPVAPTHVAQFDGHSAFFVMLRVPDGRRAARSYLDRLHLFTQVEGAWNLRTNNLPWLATNISTVPVNPGPGSTNPVTWKEVTWVSTNLPRHILELRPDLPQFPANTEWALVRRMCVIDTEGLIRPTRVTENIQLRRYLKIERIFQVQQDAQRFFEFQLDRRQNGALRAIGKDEKGFPFVHFLGQGIDLFESRNSSSERPPRDSATLQSGLLQTCNTCHGSRGLYSVLSFTGFSSPRPADLVMVDLAHEESAANNWKKRQFDWGLLQGLWRQ